MQKLYPQNNFVPALIQPLSTRIAIGEAPGREEAEQGVPFVGSAGRVFDGLLSKANVDRKFLSIVNVLGCRPPDNKFPDSEDARAYISKEDGIKAIKHCVHAHVRPILEDRQWARVDLLGDKALRYVGQNTTGITAARGYQIEIDTDKL